MKVTSTTSMIDFHTHILPGIDDGSSSVENSLQMLQVESDQGVTDVVLTSHFYASQGNVQSYLKKRNTSFQMLQHSLYDGLPNLHLGAEVQYFEGISVADEIEDLRIQGTDLLLLEMPFSRWSDRVIQDVLSLNERKGIQILLAHVDRYMYSQSNELWYYLSQQNILMQANTSFFKGFWDRRKAVKLVENGVINVLGTDCHNVTSRAPDWSKVPQTVLSAISQNSILKTYALSNS